LIGPARIGEEAVDGAGAFVRACIGEEGGELVRSGDEADGVESDAAEEGGVGS